MQTPTRRSGRYSSPARSWARARETSRWRIASWYARMLLRTRVDRGEVRPDRPADGPPPTPGARPGPAPAPSATPSIRRGSRARPRARAATSAQIRSTTCRAPTARRTPRSSRFSLGADHVPVGAQLATERGDRLLRTSVEQSIRRICSTTVPPLPCRNHDRDRLDRSPTNSVIGPCGSTSVPRSAWASLQLV